MQIEQLSIRLTAQLRALSRILQDGSPETIRARPVPDKWSAHENLAHLARHHDVFVKRLDRILREDGPRLPRYLAEEDPEWPEWRALSTDELLIRLKKLRDQLTQRIESLSPAQPVRVGVHPTFGEMTVVQWVEFFLLHEAHHLYVMMKRLGQARRT